jgi:DNA-binding NarL/FixJ family response regulator
MCALRTRGGGADEELVELAWEAFAAGFSAREGEGTTERRAPTETPVGRGPADIAAPSEAAGRNDDALAELVAHLSPRRLEVLRLVARGLTNREIGEVLGISAHTVKAHVAGLLEALDLTNRTEAAVALHEYETLYGAEDGASQP